MDFALLDKSSKVTPMLVKLYDTHKLYSLAKDKQPLARTELSRAICEILQEETTDTESELIADVLIGLMRQAEADLKAALSERLSIMDTVPLRIALYLANEEIDVAAPMLSKSMILGDLDLLYIIKSKNADYWQAIAKRPEMSDQLINVLAETRDGKTVHNLIENNNIILPELAMNVSITMAEAKEDFAKSLLRRDDVTPAIASRLYAYVGQELKKHIAKTYPVETDTLLKVVDDVVLEFSETAASQFTPTNTMIKAAQRFKEKKLLTIALMLNTLRRGQFQSFIAQFAAYTGLTARSVEEILKQNNGQGLAVACKAFDILKPDFVTIFLLTSRLRESGSMVDVTDMSKAVTYYNKVERAQALSILKKSQK